MIKRFISIVALFWLVPPLAFTYWSWVEFIQALRGWTVGAWVLVIFFNFITMYDSKPSPAPLDDLSELED